MSAVAECALDVATTTIDDVTAMAHRPAANRRRDSRRMSLRGRGRRYHLRPARPAARLHFRRALRSAKTPFASFIRATNRRPPTWPSAMRRRAATSARALWCPDPAFSTRRRRSQPLMRATRRCFASPDRFRPAHIGGGLGFLHEIPDQTGCWLRCRNGRAW